MSILATLRTPLHTVSTPEKQPMSLEIRPSPTDGLGTANGLASAPVVGVTIWSGAPRLDRPWPEAGEQRCWNHKTCSTD